MDFASSVLPCITNSEYRVNDRNILMTNLENSVYWNLKKNKILNFKFNHNMDGKNPIFSNICMPCRALFYWTVHFLFIIMKWNSLDHQSKPWQKSLILVEDFLPPQDMLQSNKFSFTTPNYYDPICLSCWYQKMHFSLIFLFIAPGERAKNLKHNPSLWRHQTHKRAHI